MIMKSKHLRLASNANNVRFVPECYARSLKPFQIEGIRFLNDAYLNQSGAILNDGVGLGKTIQTIVFISTLLAEKFSNCLIICDKSKSDHWLYHLQNWTDHRLIHTYKFIKPENGFYLCTIEEATELQKFDWKIVVIDDLNTDYVIKKLKISCKFKLWLAKDNLLDNVKALSKILKWMSNKIAIPFAELEFSDSELNTGIFQVWCKRQKLSIFCQNWLLRRTESMVFNSLPLISPKVFQDNFRMWKKIKSSEEPIDILNESPEKNNSESSLILLEDNQDVIEVNDSESDQCSPSILSPKQNYSSTNTSVLKSENYKRKGTKDITGLKFKRSKNPENLTNDLEITTSKHNKTHFLEILFSD